MLHKMVSTDIFCFKSINISNKAYLNLCRDLKKAQVSYHASSTLEQAKQYLAQTVTR